MIIDVELVDSSHLTETSGIAAPAGWKASSKKAATSRQPACGHDGASAADHSEPKLRGSLSSFGTACLDPDG
ncbi:hypothetical protein OG992_31730 [Micromonospora sp. NBC_00362]|uniref:hypothetical protein n=1 Tax=Micromonospora sp. NBC_00362 TaxID=2975975 RepID=UPI00224FFB30|nr:hypothetical protein [Micromonospora sp. NBC_00362]MCX5121750.1 hypothetical protein [Micromonospora sp. NBC_00362]